MGDERESSATTTFPHHGLRSELRHRARALAGSLRFRGFDEELEELARAKTDRDVEDAIAKSTKLEKIVRATERPALLVREDAFETPVLAGLLALIEGARTAIETALLSVGRVEMLEGPDRGMVGTAWMIAPRVAVTNRHVALWFARRASDGTFPFRKTVEGRTQEVVLDFREDVTRSQREFPVTRVIYIAPDDDSAPDVALLEVAPRADRALPAPIPLHQDEPLVGQSIAVIGYPARDSEEVDQEAMNRLFGLDYEVKRVSPGQVIGTSAAQPAIFAHDATTLGGNSGSCSLDLDTGAAMGLHFSGVSRVANYAVRARTLLDLLEELEIEVPAPMTRPTRVIPTNGVAAAPPAPDGEEARRREAALATELDARNGYDPAFLGAARRVPLPQPVAERMREMLQRDDGSLRELKYANFSIYQNADRGFPMISGVHIDGTKLRRVPRARDWRLDPRVPAASQRGATLYANNDLDRGHVVRRLDPVWGELATQANTDTFFYTNSVPQQHVFNDEVWGDLEDYILDSASQDGKLLVLTGPVLASDDPPYRDALIPRRFWKIVGWRKDEALKIAGFVLDQDEFLGDIEFNPFRFSTYQTSLGEIARIAGITFAANVKSADVLAGEATARRIVLRRASHMRLG
ncbi:DNA/RNA non-specific endonuclease [Sandaracinus amylolyticus]|uniref:DNA/RNA non-specific endonuclease n=1 Tax=Sandaracinus amylolyticus TaxID=927083 RepID=UPI001F215FBD|nr:DNA/RNA non-specific endonuclease [Sandaracinus amylolyticus]UJR84861.1 Hypothetical protein I5071_69400 [Sandaracinus amylolyticus]